jgi:hypothetical protein
VNDCVVDVVVQDELCLPQNILSMFNCLACGKQVIDIVAGFVKGVALDMRITLLLVGVTFRLEKLLKLHGVLVSLSA